MSIGARRDDAPPLRRLLDDAAVFPPGLAPVDRAVREFRERRTGPYAVLIGPLLIGAGAVGELLDAVQESRVQQESALARESEDEPLEVTLIARPGTPLEVLAEAVTRVRTEAASTIRLTGVELPHSPQWRTVLGWGLPVAVEVDPAAPDVFVQLEDLVSTVAEGLPVRAKLRTQSTPDRPLPDAAVLGRFILWCVRHGLAFKLTGGLHHAVPTEVALPGGGSETQHGLLNVLLATEVADSAVHGADAAVHGARSAAHGGDDADGEAATPLERVIATLEARDAPDLARRFAHLADDRVRAARTHFTAYGCCGVMDPIGELTALGLLPHLPDDTDPTDKDT